MSDNIRLLYVKCSPVENETVVYAFFCLLPIKFIYSVPSVPAVAVLQLSFHCKLGFVCGTRLIVRDRTFVTNRFSFELFITKPRKQRKIFRIGGDHRQCAGDHVAVLDDSSFTSVYLTFSTRSMDSKLIN
jgi:hypothetical protein